MTIWFLLLWIGLAKLEPDILLGNGVLLLKSTNQHVIEEDMKLRMSIKMPLPNSTIVPDYKSCAQNESELLIFERAFNEMSLRLATELINNLGLSEHHKNHLMATRYAAIHSSCTTNEDKTCGDERYFCCANKSNLSDCGLLEKIKFTSENNELEWRTHDFCVTKYDEKYQYGDNKIHNVKTWSNFINYPYPVGVQDARKAPFDNNVNTFMALKRAPGATYKVKLQNYMKIDKMNTVKIVLGSNGLTAKDIIKRTDMVVNYLNNEDNNFHNCENYGRPGKREGWISLNFKCGNTTVKEINIKFNLDLPDPILIGDIVIHENFDNAPKNLLKSVPYAKENENNWL